MRNLLTTTAGVAIIALFLARPGLGGIGGGSIPGGVGGPGSDPTAIHDDTAGEISAIVEKVTPVSADLVLIEDSADSNNKKRVQVGNLPTPAGMGDVVGPASATDEAICRYDGITGKLIQNSGVTLSDTDVMAFPAGGQITISNSNPGAVNEVILLNSSTTSNSQARLNLEVANTGNAGVDSFVRFAVTSGAVITMGMDNSDSDAFVISNDETLGSNNRFRLAPAGDMTLSPAGDLTLTTAGAGKVSINLNTIAANGDATFNAAFSFEETAGPTLLTVGAIADGQNLQRSGTTVIGVTPNGAPKQLVSFDANLVIFPSTSPAAAASRNGRSLIAFNADTDENIIRETHMSEDYSNGALTVEIHWVAATATSNSVVWDVAFERTDAGGLDIDADGFAAVQSSTDATNATSGVVTISSIAFTQAQADGITAGDVMRIKVTRDADNGSDDMTGDAQILEVSVFQ